MVKNPFAPPNSATRRLAGRLAIYSDAVRRGVIQVPILDVTKLRVDQNRLEPFSISAQQTTAAPLANAINWVIDQDFDRGFMGLITGIYNDYPQPPGNGYVDGNMSTGLAWVLAIDWRYVPRFGLISQRLGSRTTPYAIDPGVPVYPGQNIKFGYYVPAASIVTTGGATKILVGLSGYKFPATKNTTM